MRLFEKITDRLDLDPNSTKTDSCPSCGEETVYRSSAEPEKDDFLWSLGLSLFRCRNCDWIGIRYGLSPRKMRDALAKSALLTIDQMRLIRRIGNRLRLDPNSMNTGSCPSCGEETVYRSSAEPEKGKFLWSLGLISFFRCDKCDWIGPRYVPSPRRMRNALAKLALICLFLFIAIVLFMLFMELKPDTPTPAKRIRRTISSLSVPYGTASLYRAAQHSPVKMARLELL